jgi:hypothetical protein
MVHFPPTTMSILVEFQIVPESYDSTTTTTNTNSTSTTSTTIQLPLWYSIRVPFSIGFDFKVFIASLQEELLNIGYCLFDENEFEAHLGARVVEKLIELQLETLEESNFLTLASNNSSSNTNTSNTNSRSKKRGRYNNKHKSDHTTTVTNSNNNDASSEPETNNTGNTSNTTEGGNPNLKAGHRGKKVCPACFTLNPTRAYNCKSCDGKFHIASRKKEDFATLRRLPNKRLRSRYSDDKEEENYVDANYESGSNSSNDDDYE